MRAFASAILLSMLTPSLATALEPWPSGRLELELEKLRVLGSVLYVAAHPDDENTTLIAYLANEAKVRTTYLSLTRGDGGQNLVGADLGEKLGLIRTQELLAAREIDGGQQIFGRAIDFGYSKTSAESLEIWGKTEALADVVWAIRSTRPDVIITRFSLLEGFTHGHHTASALLAREAFTAAADPKSFPEQLAFVEPWTAKRLLWNTSSWFYKRREIEFDPTGLLRVDVGGYNPLLGESYPEIAARSRSAHRSQGFGTTAELGESFEYFTPLAGDATTDALLAGVDTTWTRVAASAPVAAAIDRAIAAYLPADPSRAIPDLIAAHRALTALPDQFWRTEKLRDLERVIAACLGLDLESLATTPSAVAGTEVSVTLRAVQRSPFDVSIAFDFADPVFLPSNQLVETTRTVSVPASPATTQPYWLTEPAGRGSFTVTDQQLIGRPANPPTLPLTATVTVDGTPFTHTLATTHNFTDPIRGEVKEPFIVTPPAMIKIGENTEIFGTAEPRPISARILARSAITGGQLRFVTTDGWKIEPATFDFDAQPGDEIPITATLTPPPSPSQSTLTAELVIDGQTTNRGYERIDPGHIPAQTLFPIAQAKLVALDVKLAATRVGTIPGAGDEIPEALRRMGATVDTLGESDLTPANLARYDAVVLGIRAVNTNDRITFHLPALFDYAANGGVVISQYNTSQGLQTEAFTPAPLTLSRDRVTDETAPVEILAPDHPAMTFPNAITATDFEGWVQERGLYFASKWDPAFTPILAIADPDEPASQGSLLIERHGEGWFVYTGLSFFRQLPAGVPGAYRLFANLVSLGHSNDE